MVGAATVERRRAAERATCYRSRLSVAVDQRAPAHVACRCWSKAWAAAAARYLRDRLLVPQRARSAHEARTLAPSERGPRSGAIPRSPRARV